VLTPLDSHRELSPLQFLIKTLISALLITCASEAAKRWPWFGALIISLPVTSIIAFGWLYHDTHDLTQIANLSYAILWLILPSLVLFNALPWLLQHGWSFWTALAIASLLTVFAYGAMMFVLRHYGIVT
jgi:hypothetical protein